MKRSTWTIGIAALTTLSLSSPVALAAQTQQTYPTQIEVAGQSVMTVTHIVAKSSGNATSWISAMDIATILRKMGIDAHWIPGENQLMLNMPSGMTVPTYIRTPYHKPKPGQFVIIANSKTIAYPPILSVKSGVYLPVYYVMQALQKLGISTRWSGSAWDIPAEPHGQPVMTMTGDLNKTFSLKLTDQTSRAGVAQLPTPPVPPATPVSVRLPMNALLQSTNQPIANADENLPLEDYVQTGRAIYVVNKQLAQVESWFKAAYAAQGFKLDGTGSSGNFKTGQNVQNQTYVPVRQAANQQEQVAMSYDAVGPNQTKVEYWVTDLVVPARPSSSDVPSGATSLDVKIVKSGTGSSNSSNPTTATVTSASKIEAVTSAINQLKSIDPPGISSGGPAISSTSDATLTFHYADGHAITVKASKFGSNYGDVTVDKVPLLDAKGTVWNAMMQAMQ